MGVYFPYMVVDVNSEAFLRGKGERLVRTYTRGSDENKKRYYDADLYRVERYFDLTIKGLTVESNSDKIKKSDTNTNNVINAIMPFDTENCVKWNARHAANTSLTMYDRGVRWEEERLDIKGTQWKAAYLPVWLYSYQEVKDASGNYIFWNHV